MQTARIEKRIGVRADKDRLWELVADLTRWPEWNPIEGDASGAIAFGGQLSLTETILGLPERRVEGRVVEWTPYQQLVIAESRGLWFRSLRYFEIEELEPGSCIAANGFIFSGLRGEMFHDKHRRLIRDAVDAVGERWKAAAEG